MRAARERRRLVRGLLGCASVTARVAREHEHLSLTAQTTNVIGHAVLLCHW